MRFFVKAKPVQPTPKSEKKKRMAEEGLRYVTFVVPIDEWETFKRLFCKEWKPNAVFNSILSWAITDGTADVNTKIH